MTQKYSGDLEPLFRPQGTLSNGNTRTFSAGTHWIGGTFYAPVTGTIDKVQIFVGSVTSPVCTLEVAITNVDSSGFPLGSDISKSSDYGSTLSGASMADSTAYELTVSASVTRGALYGWIARLTSYTSGSFTLYQGAGPVAYDSVFYGFYHPVASFYLGTGPNKYTCVQSTGIRFGSTLGYVPMVGYGGHINQSALGASSNTGYCFGNIFTVDRPITVGGYVTAASFRDGSIGICSGSDSTFVSGSEITVPYSEIGGSYWTCGFHLPTPILLLPGTHRVVFKNSGLAAPTFGCLRNINQDRLQQIIGLRASGVKTTLWSGSWLEYDYISAIWPLVYARPDDAPIPQFILGV